MIRNARVPRPVPNDVGREGDRRRAGRAHGAGVDRAWRDSPGSSELAVRERAGVHLVALAHDVVGVDLRAQPVDAGLHVGDVDPLERERAVVQVAPAGGDALDEARARGLVLAAEVVRRGGVDAVRRPVRLDPGWLSIRQKPTFMRGRDLGRLVGVPQRVARGVLQVPVVVAVLGLPDHLRVAARVVEEGAVAAVHALRGRSCPSPTGCEPRISNAPTPWLWT